MYKYYCCVHIIVAQIYNNVILPNIYKYYKEDIMKITIEKAPFLHALSHINAIVERKHTLHILANVLLQTSQDGLHLKGTDMDITITDKTPAQVHESGATTTPVALLFDVVKKLPDGAEISLQTDGDTLLVSAGRSKFKLPTLPTDSFPTMPEGDLPHKFVVGASEFATLIHYTKLAISTEETRYYLNGIYMHESEGSLFAVSTDGHRLAKALTPIGADASGIPGVIIPRKTVLELQKLLDETDDDVTIRLSENIIEFSMKSAVITSKLIDGTFPEYERVIPKDNDKSLSIPCVAFALSVGRVAALAALSDSKMYPIKMALGDNILSLHAFHSDFGTAEDEMEIVYDNDSIEIGFNASYLLDIANQIKDGNIIFELKDESCPCIIRCDADPSILYVLMPMRV